MSKKKGGRKGAPAGGKGRIAGYGMSEEDERVFRDWLESLILQDPRYNAKAIIVLAREAMIDAQFRVQVTKDPEGCLRALGAKVTLPDGLAVNFIDNTKTTLNVLLPPRAGTASERFGRADQPENARAVALRERLQSRTSGFPFFNDDWNLSDFGPKDLSIFDVAPPA
jgi:hypothetical protein